MQVSTVSVILSQLTKLRNLRLNYVIIYVFSKPAYAEAVRSTKKFDTDAENMVKEAIETVKEKMSVS